MTLTFSPSDSRSSTPSHLGFHDVVICSTSTHPTTVGWVLDKCLVSILCKSRSWEEDVVLCSSRLDRSWKICPSCIDGDGLRFDTDQRPPSTAIRARARVDISSISSRRIIIVSPGVFGLRKQQPSGPFRTETGAEWRTRVC